MPVINRLRLVYGDEIIVRMPLTMMYGDVDEWKKELGLDTVGLGGWLKESRQRIGVPMVTEVDDATFPKDVSLASCAAMAARLQGLEQGERYFRALNRMIVVEGRRPIDEKVFVAAAEEAGLDLAAFRFDLAAVPERTKELAHQVKGLEDLGVTFYNITITDGRRRITLDYAFDPAEVESAIDWLTGGKLAKQTPQDVLGYIRAQGIVSTVEIARVFGLDEQDALEKLQGFKAQGLLTHMVFAEADHWEPVAEKGKSAKK